MSRFARNTFDLLSLVREVKATGASVFFEKEKIDTAEMADEFLLTMQAMTAQEESINISKNCRWSVRKRMEDGSYENGIAPFGFRWNGDGFDIDKHEAEIVREIFALYLSGHGTVQIAQKISTEYGQKFNTNTLLYMLQNPRYCGDNLLGKYYTDDFPFRLLRNHGQRPMYYIENTNAAIISKADFELAQKIRTSKSTNNIPTEYLLTRKIYCSCGSCFRRRVTHDKVHWECRRHNQNSALCATPPIAESKIYNAFLIKTNKLILNREYILLPLIEQLETLQKREQHGVEIYKIDRQIAELNAQNHTIARLHTSGLLDSADFASQSAGVNHKISTLRSERRKMLGNNVLEDTIYNLRQLSDTLAEKEIQTEFDENLFAQIVERVNEKLQFHFIGGLVL